MPKHRITRTVFVSAVLAFGALCAHAQIEPDSAHVNLYFPQLADGGPRSQQWQTSFLFVNPSITSTASVKLYIYGNDGSPLSLDLGSGPGNVFTFTVPPQGSRIFRSKIAGAQTSVGWASAFSNLPLQATVLFTNLVNGSAIAQVSAPSTLPSSEFWSSANSALGVAVANIYTGQSITIDVNAYDSNGHAIATAPVTLGPQAHTSFNLNQLLPSLPGSFAGSITISARDPAADFVAWTLNVDSGTISSLPPGNARWPISHWDRIWLVYLKVFDAAQRVLQGSPDLSAAPATKLVISGDQVINAFAQPDGTLQINLALSELISDSESELAFAIAHELGHMVQYKTGKLIFNSNREFDADQYGMLFSLVAGYDPYAAAGTLAKLSMATGDASLISQQFDNLSGDLHGSFNNRIATVYATISGICSTPAWTSFCDAYKSVVHPNFPGGTPLRRPVPTR